MKIIRVAIFSIALLLIGVQSAVQITTTPAYLRDFVSGTHVAYNLTANPTPADTDIISISLSSYNQNFEFYLPNATLYNACTTYGGTPCCDNICQIVTDASYSVDAYFSVYSLETTWIVANEILARVYIRDVANGYDYLQVNATMNATTTSNTDIQLWSHTLTSSSFIVQPNIQTLNEDPATAVTLNLLGFDAGIAHLVPIANIYSLPSYGTIYFTGTSTLVNIGDSISADCFVDELNQACVDYMPNINFNGEDYFYYDISLGGANTPSTIGVLNISVNAINDPIIIQPNDIETIGTATAVYFPLQNNEITVTPYTHIQSVPLHGTLYDYSQTTALVQNDVLTQGCNVNGVITGCALYVPDTGYYGVDSFQYYITDGTSLTVISDIGITNINNIERLSCPATALSNLQVGNAAAVENVAVTIAGKVDSLFTVTISSAGETSFSLSILSSYIACLDMNLISCDYYIVGTTSTTNIQVYANVAVLADIMSQITVASENQNTQSGSFNFQISVYDAPTASTESCNIPVIIQPADVISSSSSSVISNITSSSSSNFINNNSGAGSGTGTVTDENNTNNNVWVRPTVTFLSMIGFVLLLGIYYSCQKCNTPARRKENEREDIALDNIA